MAITDFKTNFQGGSRANRFYIEGDIPTFSSVAGSITSKAAFTKFHVRSTMIPQLSTKTLSYDYFGRKYHYPGEKDYGTWSFTVLDDNTTIEGDLWKKFHQWQDAINNHDNNKSFQATGVPSATTADSAKYKAINWRINHLLLDGESKNSLKTFIMHGCWPTAIQPISFNMANPNSLNSFVVIMVYDYIELIDSSGTYITKQN
jgi:hypothetical protein